MAGKDSSLDKLIDEGDDLADERAMSPQHTEFQMRRFPSTIALPENIYGAAMMASFRAAHDGTVTTRGLVIILWLGLVLNILIQGYVLFCTNKYITWPAVLHARAVYDAFESDAFSDGILRDDWQTRLDAEMELGTEELCQMPLSQPLFCLAILLVWTSTGFVDLKQSFLYIMQMWRLPTTVQSIVTSFEDDLVVVKGLCQRVKIMIFASVFLPKICIAVGLWWLGARWLLSTLSFSDLMLGAVALAFITDLDELVYAVLVPEDIHALVQMYRLHRSDADQLNTALATNDHSLVRVLRDSRFRARVLEMFLSLLVVVVVPVVYMFFLQRAIPNYRWDVQHACEDRINAMLKGHR